MKNPYAQDLGSRDALASLADTPERIRSIVSRLADDDFSRRYRAGKWTMTQLLDHLAQAEMIFGLRVRMALTSPDYVVQPYDQDAFMALEGRHTGREAFEAYYALRRFNLPLFRSLTEENRQRRFTHPEHGDMDVATLLALMAGHELHHLPHFQQAADGIEN